MFHITLDTALNLVWLGVGIVALVLLVILEPRWFPQSTRHARSIRFTAVFIVAVALFPSVSSSDDLFSFSLLNSHLGKHGGFGNTVPEDSKEKAGMQLFRLLETINHCQLSQVYSFFLVLCCTAFILTIRRDALTRVVVCRAGRAPPLS
jgi:hypothetical protein